MNEKELNTIDDKVTSLKKKRIETTKQISELKVAPRKFEQEAIWASFEMQITLAIDYCDKLVNLETLLDENLEEFKFLGSFTAEKKRMTEEIFSLREEIVGKISDLEGKLDDSSTQMDFMSNTLAEMKNDSQDPKGDYYTIQD